MNVKNTIMEIEKECRMNIEEIGLRIVNARKALHYTQKQLADILMVSDKAVSKWERGVGCPDVSLLIPLSEALHMSVEELISGQTEVSEEQHKKTMQEIILYTKKMAIEHSRGILKVCYLLVMLGLFIGSGVALITEYFLFSTFTWSLITLVACIYAGCILSTLYLSKTKNIQKAVIVAGIGVLGLLYTIANVFFTTDWFIYQALPMAIISSVYACIIAWIWINTKMNIYYKISWTVLLTIPINVLANTIGNTYTIFTTINVFTNLLVTIIVFIVGRYKDGKI